MEQEKDVSCAVFSDGVGRAFAPEQIEHNHYGLKLWSDPDMINSSIESFDFLFWHEINFWLRFLKILWKTDKVNFTSSNLMCVYTHSKFQNIKFSWSVSHKIFKNRTQNVFSHAKIENQRFQIDELIISGSLQSFDVRKLQNKFL